MREMIRHNEGYMPVLAEAAATAVRTRREEDFQFVLNMLDSLHPSFKSVRFSLPVFGDDPVQCQIFSDHTNLSDLTKSYLKFIVLPKFQGFIKKACFEQFIFTYHHA